MLYRFKVGKKSYLFVPFAQNIWDESKLSIPYPVDQEDQKPDYRGLDAIKFIKKLSKVDSIEKVNFDRSFNAKYKELYRQLLKPWMNYSAAINANRKHILAGYTHTPIKLTPLYIIIDNGISSIQSYDYFWDDDPKFQSVFRDDMGGNHQWLFFWVNTGGRSGMAAISEHRLPPLLAQLIPKWYSSSDQDSELTALVTEYPKGSIPEFDKQEQFLLEKVSDFVDQGMDQQEAFEKTMRQYYYKIKAQDPEVYYPEYAKMGFPHPRPDYRDERYK